MQKNIFLVFVLASTQRRRSRYSHEGAISLAIDVDSHVVLRVLDPLLGHVDVGHGCSEWWACCSVAPAEGRTIRGTKKRRKNKFSPLTFQNLSQVYQNEHDLTGNRSLAALVVLPVSLWNKWFVTPFPSPEPKSHQHERGKVDTEKRKQAVKLLGSGSLQLLWSSCVKHILNMHRSQKIRPFPVPTSAETVASAGGTARRPTCLTSAGMRV
jgi:hypothetical protein